MFREDKYGSWESPYPLYTNKSLIRQVLQHMDLTVEECDQPSKLEQKLCLYSHLASNPITSNILQEELGTQRQKDAFLRCTSKDNYHALASLYYAIQGGENALGHPNNSTVYVAELRDLKLQGVDAPKILLMGFSSNYCVENLAAMLHLTGFETSKVVAFDKSTEPLNYAQSTFGDSLFSTNLEYQQGNALQLPFKNEEFDAVVTHFLFTHINSKDRGALLNEVHRVLKPERKFINQEILIPETIDVDRFAEHFKTLASGYVPSSDWSTKSQVEAFMYKFGSFPVHAFDNEDQLRQEVLKANFLINVTVFGGATLYSEKGTRVRAEKVNLTAKKTG